MCHDIAYEIKYQLLSNSIRTIRTMCFICVVTEIVNGTAQFVTAKAIFITFVINNHANEEANKPAEA